MHDVIGAQLDLDSNTIRFRKNGLDLGEAFKIPAQLNNRTFFPAVVLKVTRFFFAFNSY